MDKKYIYWDGIEHRYSEIDEDFLSTPEKTKDWFGYIEDHLNSSDELVIYEVVPYKILKKEINFKFKENDTN